MRAIRANVSGTVWLGVVLAHFEHAAQLLPIRLDNFGMRPSPCDNIADHPPPYPFFGTFLRSAVTSSLLKSQRSYLIATGLDRTAGTLYV